MFDLVTIGESVGLAALAAVVGLRARRAAQWRDELVTYRLRFPRGTAPDAVVSFVTGLSGLTTSWARQPVAVRAVMVELVATSTGIEHYLITSPTIAPLVLGALRAALPGVVVAEDDQHQPIQPTSAWELALSSTRRPLDVARPAAVAASVLATLQPLATGERVVVQWSARPVGPPHLVPAAVPTSGNHTPGWMQAIWSTPDHDPEVVKAARVKQATPLFVVSARLGVQAATVARAGALLARVRGAFAMVAAPGVQLYRRRLPGRLVARNIAERRMPVITYPCVLNAAELAALMAFPVGDVLLPGVQLAGCRPLAPAADIPSQGRVLAEATFPGAERPLALSVADSYRHVHLLGPTGSGKSTVILDLVTQDMAAGRGVVVVDPKADLVADILDRVPAHRADDVIVLDPADEERPVGLNLLDGRARNAELVAEQVVGIFHQLYRASWGPRTDDILRSCLLTLAGVPGMTLCEIPLLLTDAGFRRRLVGRLDDPVALGPFWAWFEGLSDAQRAEVIAPVLNKTRAVLLRRRLRNVVGQARPALDLDRALAERRILLVPLSKGLLGEGAAALLGSLVIARVWQAVQRRAALPPQQRPGTFLFVDEFQDYLNLPMSLADILAEARSLRLGMHLAHQHLDQLPASIRHAVMANARSRMVFQLSASDAHLLAREYAPYLHAADLQGLGRYEVVATLSAGSRVAPPVTGRTQPPPAPTGQGAAIRAASRERYGISREEVEQAIRLRHGDQPGPGPIGRREVSS